MTKLEREEWANVWLVGRVRAGICLTPSNAYKTLWQPFQNGKEKEEEALICRPIMHFSMSGSNLLRGLLIFSLKLFQI